MALSPEVVLTAVFALSAFLHPLLPQVFGALRVPIALWLLLLPAQKTLRYSLFAAAGLNLSAGDWLVVGGILTTEKRHRTEDPFSVGVKVAAKLLLVLSVQSLSPWGNAKTPGLAIGVACVALLSFMLQQALTENEAELGDNRLESADLQRDIRALRAKLMTAMHSPDLQRTKSAGSLNGDLLSKLKRLTPVKRDLKRMKSQIPAEPALFPSSTPRRQFSFNEIDVDSLSLESEESMKPTEGEQLTFPSNDSSLRDADLSHEDIDGLITNIMSHEYVLWHHKQKHPHGTGPESSLLNQLQQFTSSIPGVSRTTFNPASLARVPLQVLLEENEELAEVMSRLGDWDFNMLDLVRCTSEPLKEVSYYLFSTHSIPEKFAVNRGALVKFIREVERRYKKENFYHNSLHAADVLNSVIALMAAGLHRCGHFLDLEVFGLLVAALGHDVNHPGVNNAYLVNTSDPLALRYNDKSVLEMMHASTLFTIFSKVECNILTGLHMADFHRFRKVVLDLILATDLQRHFSIQSEYRRDLEESTKTLSNEDFRLRTLEICIKCADLGHGAKETGIHIQWTELISHEFFAQGDREAALGLQVSPLCARGVVDIPKAQIGFLSIMVTPLFQLWEELVKLHGNWDEDLQEYPYEICCRRIGENLQFWECEVTKLETRGGEYRLSAMKPPLLVLTTA